MARAVLRGRDVHDPPETATEMGVIIEPACQSDLGNRLLGFSQHLCRIFDSNAQQVLPHRRAKRTPESPFELTDRKVGHGRQTVGRQWLIETLMHVLDDFRERSHRVRRFTNLFDTARKSRNTNDVSTAVMKWNLAGHHQSRRARRFRGAFDPVQDRLARLEHNQVIGAVFVGSLFREEVVVGAADRFGFGLHAAVFTPPTVQRDESALPIFDEKRNAGQ